MEHDDVSVRVYNIGTPAVALMVSNMVGENIDGIWHTSVVVFGLEYYFHGGIYKAVPNSTPFGYPVKIHNMGKTAVKKEFFEEYLKHIESDFAPHKYDLLNNNCNNFSDTILNFLTGQGLPEYILEVQKLAAESEAVSSLVNVLFKPPQNPQQ